MGAKTGMNAKLYYKVGGVAGQGDWVELTDIKDNTLNLEKGEADVSVRGNNGWKATVGTLKSGSVEFEMVWDPDDAGFTALSDAYFEDKAIGLAILDGAKETGTGLVADFAITNFSRKEPLEEAMSVSVTAKPTYSATAPVWMEILWALNKLYAQKPTWAKYEGAIISAVRFAEKEIPDDTPNAGMAKLDQALKYVLATFEEVNGRRATTAETASLKEGIQIVHNELDSQGALAPSAPEASQ